MDIFSVISMVGGLALFLFGMHVMGDGLTRASGGRLEKILEKLTSSPAKAVILGAGVTAVIQSSSATTVMVVGFVNSGIMRLSQAIGIIMGANIGTTTTAWLLSLSEITGTGFFLQLLKPSTFSPIMALVGVAFIMFSKKQKKVNLGYVLVGFAVLMVGMDTMSSAVEPLKDVPEFANILVMFSNPILGILAGALLTAIIQSSSASVGILQALCATGAVTFGSAIPIILGQNIGTCITALLSGIGANKNARRAALVHLYFNIIGTSVFMILFYVLNGIFSFDFVTQSANKAGIAVVHTIFNISATLTLIPFSKVLEKLAYMTIKDEPTAEKSIKTKEEEDFKRLDARFLETPGLAVEQCHEVTISMANLTKTGLFSAFDLLENFDDIDCEHVKEIENTIDKYEDKLGTYMVKLSQKQLSEKESHMLSILLHSLSDFERISDHSVNIAYATKELNSKGLDFSPKASEEIKIYASAVRNIVSKTVEVFCNNNSKLAAEIEPLEEVINGLSSELKQRHINRLQKGKCTTEMGFILTDLCTSFERIADHCSNIAVCLVQVQADGYDTHEYLHTLKSKDNDVFNSKYEEFKAQYKLPLSQRQ